MPPETALAPAAPPIEHVHTRLTFLPMRVDARVHEVAVHRGIAMRLAGLMGCSFAEIANFSGVLPGTLGYTVPNETLTSIEAARALGIDGDDDVFGGVVPYPYVATKTITHPLVHPDAERPAGWSTEFPARVERVVLPGYAVFSAADARVAGRLLLDDGAVRLKRASGIGGGGQTVAGDERELDEQIEAIDAAELADGGLVIERNLAHVRTLSVGRVRIGSVIASYVGTQRLTKSRDGEDVYGGSTLQVVRGGFDALARLRLDAPVQLAVEQARVYHEAALDCYAGMFASRCNYDVAQGTDAAGDPYSGVLEQSWRIGGASGAELAAIEALTADPSLASVRASTVEVHGPNADIPPDATVYYQGDDPQVGPIAKYAYLHADAGPRTED